METKNDHINELLSDENFIRYIITVDRHAKKFWQEYRESDPAKEEAFREAGHLILSLLTLRDIDKGKDNTALKDKIWDSIIHDAGRQEQGKTTRRLISTVIKIAAVVILPLLIFAYFRFYHSPAKQQAARTAENRSDTEVQIILPGGEHILPSMMDVNESFTSAGVSVHKTGRTSLSYRTQASTESLTGEKIAYNTIIVPRGKRYSIKLPDGSMVWLNSGTEFKFPVRFAGGESRKVYLDGEAFFEVVHDDASSGFVVSTADINVVVYGTSFNVSAYNDMDRIETTLVQGDVGIDVLSDSTSVYRLKPREKADYSKDKRFMNISVVDTRNYTSWKDGYLIFHNEEMRSLGPKIERWYDIKIIYREEEIKDMRFSGIIREEKSLDHIMGLLQNACNLTYRINNKHVILFKEQEFINYK